MKRVAFIVEGHKDAHQIKGALGDVDCIVTGGTKLDNRIKSYIDFYIEKGYEVYLLSDP